MKKLLAAGLAVLALLPRPARADGGLLQSYSRDHRLVSEEYRRQGALITGPEGWARRVFSYDEEGHLTREECLGIDGEPVLSTRGYCARAFEYRNGTAVYEAYLDEDGAYILPRGVPCAVTVREVDGEGRVLRESYFDVAGRACLHPEKGFACAVYDRDPHGNPTREAWFDQDLEPMEINGCHQVIRVFDEQSRLMREQYYALDGQSPEGGPAAREWRYDQRGLITEESFYGPDGNLTPCAEGYALALYDHDGAGREVSRRYLGPTGEPARVDGCHQIITAYDDMGRKASETFLDENGNGTVRGDGAAALVYRYDNDGDLTGMVAYDLAGEPVRTLPAP